MYTAEMLCLMFHYEPITSLDYKRLEICVKIANSSDSSGKWGGIAELLSAPPKSKKESVSKQGKTDVYLKKVDSNGNASFECKSNGGGLEAVTSNFLILWLIYPKEGYTRKPRLVKKTTYFEFLTSGGLVKPQQESKGRKKPGWCALYKNARYTKFFESLPEYDRTARIDIDLIP